VEQAAKLGRWSPEVTLLAARQKLVGTALQVVQSETKLRSVTDFKELREFLIQRFKKKNTQRFYREQLGRIKKDEKESVEEYADRIKIINSLTYEIKQEEGKEEVNADILREADQRALDAFLSGLTGSSSEKVRMAMPQTLEEAVARAINVIEAGRRAPVEDPEETFSGWSAIIVGNVGTQKLCAGIGLNVTNAIV
jgi:hypothetical protein